MHILVPGSESNYCLIIICSITSDLLLSWWVSRVSHRTHCLASSFPLGSVCDVLWGYVHCPHVLHNAVHPPFLRSSSQSAASHVEAECCSCHKVLVAVHDVAIPPKTGFSSTSLWLWQVFAWYPCSLPVHGGFIPSILSEYLHFHSHGCLAHA